MNCLSARRHYDQRRALLRTTCRRPHRVGAKYEREQVLSVQRAEGLPPAPACIEGGAQVSRDCRRIRGTLRGDLALAVRGHSTGRQ
jgi:hypothetical protein